MYVLYGTLSFPFLFFSGKLMKDELFWDLKSDWRKMVSLEKFFMILLFLIAFPWWVIWDGLDLLMSFFLALYAKLRLLSGQQLEELEYLPG